MMRRSLIHPSLPAYHELIGSFDYNKTPFTPIGVKVLIHENLSVRQSWATHGTKGCYIETAMDHHRCYKVYVSKKGERISDTVEFPPRGYTHAKDFIDRHGYKISSRTDPHFKKSSPCLPIAQIWRQYTSSIIYISRGFSKMYYPNSICRNPQKNTSTRKYPSQLPGIQKSSR